MIPPLDTKALESVPWTISLPPLEKCVALTTPPVSTDTLPPFNTVVETALPPDWTSRSKPLEMVSEELVCPLETTISVGMRGRSDSQIRLEFDETQARLPSSKLPSLATW